MEPHDKEEKRKVPQKTSEIKLANGLLFISFCG
jgi:hypothetical protein